MSLLHPSKPAPAHAGERQTVPLTNFDTNSELEGMTEYKQKAETATEAGKHTRVRRGLRSIFGRMIGAGKANEVLTNERTEVPAVQTAALSTEAAPALPRRVPTQPDAKFNAIQDSAAAAQPKLELVTKPALAQRVPTANPDLSGFSLRTEARADLTVVPADTQPDVGSMLTESLNTSMEESYVPKHRADGPADTYEPKHLAVTPAHRANVAVDSEWNVPKHRAEGGVQ